MFRECGNLQGSYEDERYPTGLSETAEAIAVLLTSRLISLRHSPALLHLHTPALLQLHTPALLLLHPPALLMLQYQDFYCYITSTNISNMPPLLNLCQNISYYCSINCWKELTVTSSAKNLILYFLSLSDLMSIPNIISI